MKSSFSILAVSLSSALPAAFAADPAAPATGATKEASAASDMICGREYMTGPSIAQTKCRTGEQAEAKEGAATRSLGRTTGGPNAKRGGG